MNRITDWIELVRSTIPFVLAEQIKQQKHLAYSIGATFELPRPKMPYSPMMVHNDHFHRVDENAADIDFISLTSPWMVGSPTYPTAPSPACAQSANQITMVWATKESAKKKYKFGFDEGVGTSVPSGVPEADIIPQDTNGFMPDNSIGDFLAHQIEPHRDTFPAVIIIGGLRKWYQAGRLHRKGGHAALRADYVGAIWYQDGNVTRVNGPSKVMIKDYQEFHIKGEFCGYKHGGIAETWDNNIKVEPEFTTHPMSNRYFGDPQDEMMCLAQMAS